MTQKDNTRFIRLGKLPFSVVLQSYVEPGTKDIAPFLKPGVDPQNVNYKEEKGWIYHPGVQKEKDGQKFVVLSIITNGTERYQKLLFSARCAASVIRKGPGEGKVFGFENTYFQPGKPNVNYKPYGYLSLILPTEQEGGFNPLFVKLQEHGSSVIHYARVDAKRYSGKGMVVVVMIDLQEDDPDIPTELKKHIMYSKR